MAHDSVEQSIAGGYQIDALLRGWRFQRAWHRARLDLVARLLPPAPDALVLDAAAGAGIVTWRFPKATIVSTDMRPSACRAVRQHTPTARALAAHLGALPFPTATFTQLYLLEAIEHLTVDGAAQALAELRRVARKGARFLLTTPNYRSYWVALEWTIDALRLTPPMGDGQHLTRYNRRTLRQAVEAARWRVARLGSFNFVAPFAGMISPAAGRWALEHEVRGSGGGGALLYALCEAS